jgi:cytochrome c biogenesis protein CcdA
MRWVPALPAILAALSHADVEPGVVDSSEAHGKSLATAYWLSAATSAGFIATGAGMIAATEAQPLPDAGYFLIFYGTVLGPFTGNLYYHDPKRWLMRGSINAAALLLASYGGAMFLMDGGTAGAQGIMAYSTLGLGAFLYAGNTILGMRDFRKSESRYQGKLSVAPVLQSNGEGFRYGLRLQAELTGL